MFIGTHRFKKVNFTFSPKVVEKDQASASCGKDIRSGRTKREIIGNAEADPNRMQNGRLPDESEKSMEFMETIC